MKCPREHMEIVNAYELVGSYRGAAELCGTTHKTVKRIIERRDMGEARRRVSVTNTSGVQTLMPSACGRATDASAPSGYCRSRRRPATVAQRARSDVRSPMPR